LLALTLGLAAPAPSAGPSGFLYKASLSSHHDTLAVAIK
jgi:hypothetical protein